MFVRLVSYLSSLFLTLSVIYLVFLFQIYSPFIYSISNFQSQLVFFSSFYCYFDVKSFPFNILYQSRNLWLNQQSKGFWLNSILSATAIIRGSPLASLMIELRDFYLGSSGNMHAQSMKYNALKLAVNYWWFSFKYQSSSTPLFNWIKIYLGFIKEKNNLVLVGYCVTTKSTVSLIGTGELGLAKRYLYTFVKGDLVLV